MENWIAVIDVKAFYASFECHERGLDPFLTPLAVTDTTRKESTIVLSVSPYLKAMGVSSRCRRKDLPTNIPNMTYAIPQMEKYLKCSAQIVSIFLVFVAQDDIHVYSIDESFINLGPYLELYNTTPEGLCKMIQTKIYKETGLLVTCGIGPNMFLAKMADDKDAKNAPGYIAKWTKEDIPKKLWPIRPLKEMWGISSGYQERLNTFGLYSVYDLAHYDKQFLIKKLGVMGEELRNHANGIDDTNIREKYIPMSKNLSLGQVLMRDYNYKEIPLIIKEMTDDLACRMRANFLETSCVYLSIGYSTNDGGGGFSHQAELMMPTDLNKDLYKALIYIYDKFVENKPIRQIGISFAKLTRPQSKQLSLFQSAESEEQEENMYRAMDEVQAKYGKNKLLRTSALKSSSTAKIRHEQIGGHKK